MSRRTGNPCDHWMEKYGNLDKASTRTKQAKGTILFNGYGLFIQDLSARFENAFPGDSPPCTENDGDHKLVDW